MTVGGFPGRPVPFAILSPHASLVDNARLFAPANLAGADATIAVYDSKYAYGLWRPFQALVFAVLRGGS